MIAQHYPQAWRHLQRARAAKGQMAADWNSWLDRGPIEESVVTDPGGIGCIVATANWAGNDREELTALFRDCVTELWSGLDSLVAETVEAFSVQQRPNNPERPRYFPIADSGEAFEALLEESCLDGVLQRQYQMIRDCQPFQPDTGDETIDRFRRGLRRLTEWDHSLNSDLQVCAWATPVEPRVRVESPMTLETIEVQEPGAIEGERVIATYRVRNYEFGSPIAGQAGAYVDLCLSDGFDPVDFEDTFESRLSEAINVVARFAIYFTWFCDQAPGAKRVLLGDRPTERSWIEAADSPRRWSEEELTALTESDIGLGRVTETDDFTLIVSTPNGVFERVIPQATPLREHERRGTAAETAIQSAAATWGLPDFVMAPSVERKGAGVREISDGLLVVGAQGVIVQAKSRETEPRSAEREQSWINKHIAAGVKQIDGTARRLQSAETQMRNGRGRDVRIDGASAEWVGVVIIEHPAPPDGFAPAAMSANTPFVVLLRRDWEFLFDQLRSTHAVVSYLHRVGEPTEILGTEPERYYELAAADIASVPGRVDPTLAGIGESHSVPLLPSAPAGSDDDDAHGMVRIMLEDIATTKIEAGQRDALQATLASLDSLPVAYRTDLGRLLIDALATARQAGEGTTWWQFRTFLAGPGQVQLGFGVCSVFNEVTKAAFSAWLLLRHHERGERSGGFTGLSSVGVLLTPRHDGYRDWDTTMLAVEGDPLLSAEELREYRDLWNS